LLLSSDWELFGAGVIPGVLGSPAGFSSSVLAAVLPLLFAGWVIPGVFGSLAGFSSSVVLTPVLPLVVPLVPLAEPDD
jgi:hypothetical protein